jgi:phage-related protein
MVALTMPLANKLTKSSQKTSENRLLEARFGNGYGQVAKDGMNSEIDKWSLQFGPITGADLTTMNTFLAAVGADVWFYWTPLGESVVKKWRIDKGSKKPRMVNFTTYEINFSITQVFDLGV